MITIRSLFSVRWVRRVMMLFLVLAMSFLMGTACDDDDCDEEDIIFTPVVDEAECEADAEANDCEDFQFIAPDQCVGINCVICDDIIIDDDDI